MKTSTKSRQKSKFTKEEDERLSRAVRIHGENWYIVSKYMGNRNSRQCKERWNNYLSPNINHNDFTLFEDLRILQMYQQFGSKWVMISKHLKGRSDVSVKSRYMVLKRRGMTIDLLKKKLMGLPLNIKEEFRKRRRTATLIKNAEFLIQIQAPNDITPKENENLDESTSTTKEEYIDESMDLFDSDNYEDCGFIFDKYDQFSFII